MPFMNTRLSLAQKYSKTLISTIAMKFILAATLSSLLATAYGVAVRLELSPIFQTNTLTILNADLRQSIR